MKNPLLVMKFGGTSVGSPDRIRDAAQLVAEAARSPTPVVVSSAMSKVTDALLEAMTVGDEAALDSVCEALVDKHVAAAVQLLPPDRHEPVSQQIREIVGRYARIARGMVLLDERPPRSMDEAVAAGEKLSCFLLAESLRAAGLPAQVVDGSEIIITDAQFGAASPLMSETKSRSEARLRPLLDRGIIPVVTGFNGATEDGRPTTLGRSGSDFSASIVAAVLEANELWIWTDVDGIMTGDPRMIPDAQVLSHVTYNEAAELAFAGAKVLHPRTLQPVVDKEIPVWIKNTFNPGVPGTRISSEVTNVSGVRAITSMPKTTLISIEAVSLSQSGAQLMARALSAVARAKVEVLLLTRSSFRQNFSILIRSDEVDATLQSLQEELALELEHDYVHPISIDHSVGLLTVVGEGMRGASGLAGRLFTAISERAINIIALAQGSSELTISIVVRQDRLEEAVRAVHAECRLGENASIAAD